MINWIRNEPPTRSNKILDFSCIHDPPFTRSFEFMAVDAGFRGIGIKNCASKHGSVDYACLPGFFSYGWRATAFPYIPCPLSLLINKSGETRVSPGKSFFPRKTMESGIQPLAHNDQVVTDAIVRFQFIKPPHVQWWLTRRGSL